MAGTPQRRAKARASFGRRLLWFAALWLAGVGLVALVAFVIRAALRV